MTTMNESMIAHAIGATGHLEVRVASWSVEVVGVDGDEVRVRNADGGPLPSDLEVERGTGSLRVAQPTRIPRFVLTFGRSDVRLAIEVPASAHVAVHSASGDLAVSGLLADQQVRTASGEIRIRDAAGDVAVESVSGDVEIELAGEADITLRSVSGDASIDGAVVGKLALTTTSGDIRVASALGPGPHSISTLSGDAAIASGSGVRVVARTLSGDLSSDLPHSSDGGPGRRSMTIGDGATVVEFKSVSGDLRVVGRDPEDLRAFDRDVPAPPEPPVAAAPPLPPALPADASGDARLAILQALERGEIDVAEATDRLGRLDGASDD